MEELVEINGVVIRAPGGVIIADNGTIYRPSTPMVSWSLEQVAKAASDAKNYVAPKNDT